MAVIAKNNKQIGRVTKIDKSCPDIIIARRKFDSNNGAKIKANSIGGKGKSNLTITYPKRPKNRTIQTSKPELFTANPPNTQNTMINGSNTPCGIRKTLQTNESPLSQKLA